MIIMNTKMAMFFVGGTRYSCEYHDAKVYRNFMQACAACRNLSNSTGEGNKVISNYGLDNERSMYQTGSG